MKMFNMTEFQGGGASKNKLLKGFTLSEVLITLGVIGIVASLTIPQLIKNYQAKVLETAFKKSYSNLSKAYLMTLQELGVTNLRKAFATYDEEDKAYPLAEEFTRVFYKQLGASQEAEPYVIKNYNNTTSFTTIGGLHPTAGWQHIAPLKMLPDGSSIGTRVGGAMIVFYVDTNGPYGKPNRLGFDVFSFGVIDNQDIVKPFKQEKLLTDEELEEQAYPEIAGRPCSIKSTQKYNGYGCSYYAMNDINPDDNKSSYWKNLPK